MKKYFIFAILTFCFVSFNVKASEYLTIFNGYINGTENFTIYDGGIFDNTPVRTDANAETNMFFDFKNIYGPHDNQDAGHGNNLLLTITFCSSGTRYDSAITPGPVGNSDIINATLVKKYSISRPGTSCSVGGYPGSIFQTILNLNVTGDSFKIKTWGGHRDNYIVLTDILSVTLQDFDPGMAYIFEQNQQNQTIIDQNNQLGDKLNGVNDKLNDINSQDINDDDKKLPDDSDYKDYSSVEGDLKDTIKNNVDMTNVDIAIDANSSTWVWGTLTSFLTSHTLIFNLVITLLSIGIIKLALGR